MYLAIYGDTTGALVSAGALASSGHFVALHVPGGRAAFQSSEVPSREPGLNTLLAEQQAAGTLVVEDMEAPRRPEVSVIWLALAPAQFELAYNIVARLQPRSDAPWLVVNQSTFPVGSSEALQDVLTEAVGEGDDAVLCLPDLLVEGAALAGFTRAEHWLAGASSFWAQRMLAEILRPFNRRRDNIMWMTTREAEFTKLAISGMLATRLSFMNDMANLADTLGVDIENVRQGMGADQRIGAAYLYPGCGFGGPAFSRDVLSLARELQRSGMQSELLNQVWRINERQKEVLFHKLWQHYDANLQGRRVALWGAAFKPGTARIDNAPSLRLIQALWAQGVEVHVHDPKAMAALSGWAKEQGQALFLHDDPYDALQQADALLLVTEWKSYWSPDFSRMARLMRHGVLLDGRNIWDPEFVKERGFIYHGIGRH
ncbi:UDP-glucose dehydrogenase family protein [Kerstersia gyiorum]|uniref:UDP-glucose dehydrogenase family protein n=1 Tax=Kerstersia gyiorum TaxID=206506 RepID=UPI00209FBB17|nr:nucleotide sugar dehydrogenase [Kerstersia gyiorum]MCP1634769.1 UDPglucose 6-dehydrogenase [Kerstersia gyiorum]MCP1638198.1 UDPglucose 6-dehydrogenase [Kerstersia gyiorum]MCP1672532.1 UDPglucose 6-dehydrogenase [Kerstersia gyiorum]MCP1683821.1 UDPglucose 6-dehydrogenase [Kerstersia gyiorum]MCP1709062.1 UDPglucose 6-dehydrogenase [Kerstersia gyiorum]